MTQPLTKTAWCLLALFLCLAAVPVTAGVTLWTIEHYMAITPADWPYPGSLIDRANDFTCGLILLPGGDTGRFIAWLLFFPVPILIEAYQRCWRRAGIFLLCIILPYSWADILFVNALVQDASLPSVLVLVLALVMPPFLIQSWSALTTNFWEKRLLRANLIMLWFIFCAADILLGLNVHGNDCKLIITHALIN